MSDSVTIRLPGAPRGKGRHRAQLVQRAGQRPRIHSHPDQKTEAYEGALRLAAGAVMRARPLLTGPLAVEIFAFLPIPVSFSKRKRLDAKQTRERKAALKTRSDHLKAAQVAFNAFIRERDKEQPCICCGRTSEKQYLTGTNWDCGHYRSTGSAPHLRFNEDNAHRQLTVCNRHGAGRAVDYRIGLIARIGLARVEALETDQAPAKWTADELIVIRDTYRAKLRALKKEAA